MLKTHMQNMQNGRMLKLKGGKVINDANDRCKKV